MSSTIENSAATVTAVTQDVDARLNAAKSVTADIQAKLRRFKIEHGLMERDTTTGVERPSAEKAAATGAIATRAQLLASEARLQANSGYGDLDEPLEIFGSSVRSEKLANYRRDLGALNRQESDRGQFETTDASVAQKSQVLRRLIADEIGRLVDIERERIVVTLIDLERQEKAALDLQSSLQTQIKDIQLAGAVPSVRARIIEAAATPKKRSSPRATLILPLAVLGGLAAGLALALIKESLRQDLRSLRDIWSTLGEVPVTVLPSLALSPDPIAPIMDEEPHAAGNGVLAKAGTLPERLHKQRRAGEAAQSVRLAATGGTSGPLRSKFYRAIANYPGIVNAPQYRNALLALKQAIDRSTRKKPSKVIAVVSGLAGEGKSTTALNLALLAAESGAETLLIDLDVRGADLTREFTLQTSAIISEASEDELDDTVAPLQSGLSFLAARRAGENETLRSISAARLAALISKMRVNFDLVIVDTPGILEYPDAEMALSEVDVAILVTRFGTTLRGDVRATMSQILAAGGRDVEVVLNDCDVGNSSESISSAMRRFPFGL